MKRLPLALLALVTVLVGYTWFGETGSETETAAEVDTDTDTDIDIDTDTGTATTVGTATIEFYDPVEWPFEDILTAHESYFEENMSEYWQTQGFEAYKENLLSFDSRQFWAVGTFVSGEYSGQTLVLGEILCDDGPCDETHVRYAVDETDDEWTLLVGYSDELGKGDIHMETVAEDLNINIPALDVPESLEIYEGTSLVLMDALSFIKNNVEDQADYYSPISLDSDAFGTYFQGKNGCIYGVTLDGMLARYAVTPAIFAEAVQNYATFNQDLTFNGTDGKTLTQEYSLFSSGCGFSRSCVPSYEAAAGEDALLKEAGTLDGQTVYWLGDIGEEPEPTADSLLRRYYDAYNNYKVSLEYDTESDKALMSIEEYATSGNFFFIKLYNGEYVNVFNAEHAPTAECGKPVIYLYPEKTTIVSVKVGVSEITKSAPAYGKGWLVKAWPSGKLLNLVDGKTYPYLFWEGNSDENIPLSDGFTLAKNEVDIALPGILESLGLNAQESADFMEFWSPEIAKVNAPYIEFNFVGNKLMDQVAPLQIFPKPDRVIRIFMYFQGADEPGLPVPNFKPAARFGYTVVEWGGTLY